MKKTIMSLHLSVITLILFLLFVLNFVAYSFSGIITQYICGFGIDYTSDAAQKARAEGAELAAEICENGFTLLKNENDALPLTAKKVNVFGWGSSDNGFMYIGGGSGEGGSSRITLYEGLRNSGLELNEELVKIYNDDPHTRLGQNGLNTSVNDYYRLYEPDLGVFGGSVLARAKEFSDTALIFISRRATEGYDLTKYQYDVNGAQQKIVPITRSPWRRKRSSTSSGRTSATSW